MTPNSIYPRNAEQEYLQFLNSEITLWFDDLTRPLETHPAIRADGLFDRLFDQAIERWGRVVRGSKSILERLAGMVDRTAEESLAAQIESQAGDQGLNISLARGFLAFGDIQGQVDVFTRENVLLIKDIGEKAARDLEREIQDAVADGISTRTLTAIIQKRMDITKRRAATIARDQIGKLNAGITRIRMQAANIDKYEWVAAMDERTRPEHEKLNGTIRTWDQGPRPGEPINCRCVAVPVFEDK